MTDYRVESFDGWTRVASSLDALPLHEDWVDIDTLEEVEG